MEENNEFESKEEKEESNYFHGCRKDANCTCKMCLASITATLDLMSMSAQRSSLTKLSASKPYVVKTPVSIDPSLLSTPTSRRSSPVAEVGSSKPVFRSTAKTGVSKKVGVKKKEMGCKSWFWRWVLLFGLIVVGVEFGFSWGIFRVLKPRLSDEIVMGLVKGFSNDESLSERLKLIQKSLNDSIDGRVSSCILGDSNWKINQNSLMLLSYCSLYKSAAEEVFIRGWPLQTAGVLTAGFSSRSFSVLYGRITEWPEGKLMCVVREENTTWILSRFSASVVQFDQNTWIIEYRRSFFLENPSILRNIIEFNKLWILKFMERIKEHRWLLPKFKHYRSSALDDISFKIPT